MTHDIEKTVEILKEENLELKLDDIRKKFEVFKTDVHRHLDLLMTTNKDHLDVIQKNTEKTNGSVARVMEQIAAIEREDNKRRVEELSKKFEDYRDNTKIWETISTNRWVAGLIAAGFYALTYQEIRSTLGQVFKILF